jgi:hypothetical protein
MNGNQEGLALLEVGKVLQGSSRASTARTRSDDQFRGEAPRPDEVGLIRAYNAS